MTMIVAYVAWTISTTVSGNVFIVAFGAILAAIVLGLVIERVVMRPMLGEPVFATVMVTIGLAVILRSSINFIWDAYPHGLDLGVGRTIVRIGAIGVRTGQIAVITTLLLLLAAIWAFFRYSKFGVAMRAVAADDRTAATYGHQRHQGPCDSLGCIVGHRGHRRGLLRAVLRSFTGHVSARPESVSGHHSRRA
jgi:branched-chain amino acid transport system permease protein